MTKFFGYVLMFVLLSTSAFGSILTSDSFLNNWQPFAGNYAQGPSSDGAGLTMSDFIAGTGAFTGHSSSPNSELDWWGQAIGERTPDLGSYFTENSFPNQGEVTMTLEIAGWRNNNWLGYYQLDNPTVFKPLFVGSDTSNPANNNLNVNPILKTFTVTGDWALVFMPNWGNSTPTAGQVASSGYLQNGSGQGEDQFIIFRDFTEEFYYVGIEDTKRPGGDKDHNDMILKIKNTSAEDPEGEIPEPSTYALIGTGIVGMVWLRRRKSA